METSLNLNISSISDTPEEGLNPWRWEEKINLFVKPGKDNVVQATKPELKREQCSSLWVALATTIPGSRQCSKKLSWTAPETLAYSYSNCVCSIDLPPVPFMHPRPTVWSSFKSFHSIWTPHEQEHVVILILMTIQWQLGSNNINATFHVSCGNKCHISCGNACVNLCIHCHKSVCIQSHTSFLWQCMQRMTHVAQKANALPVCRRWPHKWNRTLLHFIQFQTCIYCAQRDLPWQHPDRRSELWKLSGICQKGLSQFVKSHNQHCLHTHGDKHLCCLMRIHLSGMCVNEILTKLFVQ